MNIRTNYKEVLHRSSFHLLAIELMLKIPQVLQARSFTILELMMPSAVQQIHSLISRVQVSFKRSIQCHSLL